MSPETLVQNQELGTQPGPQCSIVAAAVTKLLFPFAYERSFKTCTLKFAFESNPSKAHMSHEPSPSTGGFPMKQKLERHEFLLIAVMAVSAFVLILNETLLGVALPFIIEDFKITASTAQWASTGFMLTMAVVTPASGFIISRFSVRTVFVGAMTIFTAGALMAGFAPSFTHLLLGRILQAGGTGVIMPLLMTTVMRLVPPTKIGKAMGVIGMVISAAPALGPTVSGLILGIATWHWLFFSVIPIALLALIAGFVLAPRELPEGGANQKLDILSMILSTLGFGGLVMGLSSLGGESGHGGGSLPVNPWALVVVSALILAVFVWRQIKLQDGATPFMDMRVFRSFPYVLTVLLTSVSMGVMLGSSVLLPLYASNVLGLSALQTGLLLLPGGAASALLSPVVGALSDRLPARVLVIPGTIVFSGSVWLMTIFNENTQSWFIIVAYLLMSAAIPFMSTPMMGVGLGSLPKHLYSYGSSAMTAVQQVASAAATAMFVALMAIGAEIHGGEPIVAQAAGVHLALLVAACVSVVAVVIAFLVPKKK